jgi:predicted phage terminase large subunit-like protein
MDREQVQTILDRLQRAAKQASSDAEARVITSEIAAVVRRYRVEHGIGLPLGPLEQAQEIDAAVRSRPHLEYLSKRIAAAVHDVERGRNRQLAVSMPPRSGKSQLISIHTPVWLLRRHPEWKIITASHDGSLTTDWARATRQTIEYNPGLGISLAQDGGAAAQWSTVEGGGLLARSVRSGITGRGARVIIIDDPIRDFVEAHSAAMRQNLWDWWLSTAQTRLEPPFLVLVVMTRWHEDDMIGRLFNDEWEGRPADWERISIPALAEADDVIGRAEGEPLLLPLLEETPDEALARWDDRRLAVGTYNFSSMFQQRPAPAKGSVFDSSWWRFWTMDEGRATNDGRVVYLDPSSLVHGTWCDSWDMSFKSINPVTGGWVVGQRWVRDGANRYMVTQQRGRWSFTQSLSAMRRFAKTDDPARSLCGHLVHTRLIEDAANGPAIIDVLREEISGIKPITASVGKTARAHAVSPEVESGHVYLPHPADPGNDWVHELLSELRNFPNDAHDDQVDSLTQALAYLHTFGQAGSGITVPGHRSLRTRIPAGTNLAMAALSDMQRRRDGR